MATIPDFTGFHLGSTWVYTPKGIKRIIVYLQGLSCDNAEFVYDFDLASIKVTCRTVHELEIRQAFNHVAANIEREEFEHIGDEIMSTDGTINLPPAGDLISRRICDPAPAEEFETAYQLYTIPSSISTYPYNAAWKQLEYELAGLKIISIIHPNDIENLKLYLNVEISCDLMGIGKVVYIGGTTYASVQDAQRRFQVLLEIYKLSTAQAHPLHVFYVDDYVEKSESEIQVDCRYMANIDPKLPITTLLDPTVVKSLSESYKRVHEKGVTIRLKLYDPMSGHHVSTFGPKILERGELNQRLEHRPSITAPAGGETHQRLTGPLLESVPNTGSLVSEWIKNHCPTPGPESDSGSHGTFDAGQSLQSGPYLDLQGRNDQSQKFGKSLASQGQESFTGPNTPIPVGSPSFNLLGSEASGNGTSDSFSSVGLVATLSKTQPHPPQNTAGGVSKTLFKQCLPPQPLPSLVKPKNTQREKSHKQGPGSCSSGSPEGSVKCDDDDEGKLKESEDRGATAVLKYPGHLAELLDELDTALSRLVSSGPYKRNFAVRAEFGRIILANVNEDCLSFNPITGPSNVWGKTPLLKALNKEGVDNFNITHFTKILSTRESDMNSMIHVARDRARLWKTSPDQTSIVYSFYCASITDNTIQFVVDIEDGKGDDAFSCSIRPYTRRVDETYDADGVIPVYVHGLRHNWDLRIMISYTELTDEIKYGDYATSLLSSLVIVKNGNSPELRFTNDTSSGVTVKTVRIGTRWRYLSSDSKGALEIKEVEQLTVEIKPNKNGLQGMIARRWEKQKPDSEKLWGLTQRWFEASVTSTEAESLFRQNIGLGLGQKADWTPEQLRESGIFYSIYGPALAMLGHMDQVGANEDNKTKWQVKRPNWGVPGA
ncbi:hypothetical protein B0H67DRAFT_67838 [Lasiosphaeris hirsuta]|uniref:DUF7905 domain-containing protein n=1 Tax=Lasiosphaeris hirsuta TaxID=260670 RepID=A0AA40EBJ3_9PEZI|nr:hypothetical protein B0H67DRAFT_67838 [Lasiosphaeris hirsuta]